MTRPKKPAPGPLPTCEQCGEIHQRRDGRPSCSGHSIGRLRPEIKGKPCRQQRMTGQTKCKLHGGRSPQALRKAEERVTQEKIAELARTLGDPIVGKDPGEIIAEQIAWRAGHVAWLRSRVHALDPAALGWVRTVEKIGAESGLTFEAKVNVWLQMYWEASDRLERLCLDAMKYGLAERQVRLAEQQADQMVRFIDGVLHELGFDPTEPETAGVVERHLRAVA